MTRAEWRKVVVLLTGIVLVWCVVLATVCFVTGSVTGGLCELALGVVLFVTARMTYVRL